ncbi:MAG: formimidoylglutamase [Bacteroidales bacterium]|nr:formimidoylglutamase [Bacteroidales bacterium]
MTEINEYFNPVLIEPPDFKLLADQATFSHNITVHTENNPLKKINDYRIALIGVPEGRNSLNIGSSKSPDIIREQLYKLAKVPGKTKIIDLGNMKQGVTFNDTLAGLTDVLTLLLNENIFPVIIGGSSALVPAIDKAFSSLKIRYTLTEVDSRIDYEPERRETDSSGYLNKIFANPRNNIRHYINIGYQTYLNDQQVINRLTRRHADLIRVGDARQALHLTEPLFRDSDAAVFDISAVRQSDAPGTLYPSPNGFYGEEICLLARYAGISDQLKVFGIFEVNPEYDKRYQTSALTAQIIWFFLEGFSQKQYESPALSDSNTGRFIKYHVRVSDLEEDLIFIKSNFTERWWLEIKDESGNSSYVACSHEDYIKANHNEVPDRWVKAVNRLKI